MAYLESFKVNNAIILAAGFGSRFVPMSYETPKALLEVYGERMIERKINQLHQVGISDITIVVGYLKDKFNYLIDKFKVKLVFNPDYSFKNNLISLFHVREKLGNTYILPADIYTITNPYRPYEAYTNYLVQYSDIETEEWAIDIDSNDKITSVNPEGG